MGTPCTPCTCTAHQAAQNEKRRSETLAVGGTRGVSDHRFRLLTPFLGARGRCEGMGLHPRRGRVGATAWRRSPASAVSITSQTSVFAVLLLAERRLWIEGCGTRFFMPCRAVGGIIVWTMSTSHSMCIFTARGSRVTICGRVPGARVGSGACPVPRPGATGQSGNASYYVLTGLGFLFRGHIHTETTQRTPRVPTTIRTA